MKGVYKTIVILLLCIVLVFAVQNIVTVTVSFLGWSATVPLALVVMAAYLLGMVTGGGVRSLMTRSMGNETRKPA